MVDRAKKPKPWRMRKVPLHRNPDVAEIMTRIHNSAANATPPEEDSFDRAVAAQGEPLPWDDPAHDAKADFDEFRRKAELEYERSFQPDPSTLADLQRQSRRRGSRDPLTWEGED